MSSKNEKQIKAVTNGQRLGALVILIFETNFENDMLPFIL
jgi:GTP-sensing pleiotropic transcriptional regulator CodY